MPFGTVRRENARQREHLKKNHDSRQFTDCDPDEIDTLDNEIQEPDLNEGGNPPPKRKRGSYKCPVEYSASDDEDDSPPPTATAAKKETKRYRLTVDLERDLQRRIRIHAIRNDTTITTLIENWIVKYTEP